MTTIISGDSGITFPNSTVQASAGSVIQVVQTVFTSTFATTSTSLVSTGVTASITPKFSTSKILVLAQMNTVETDAAGWAEMALYRNAGSIATTGRLGTSGTGSSATPCMNLLDSPATTSSTSYTLYIKSSAGGQVNLSYGGSSPATTITLMEIAG